MMMYDEQLTIFLPLTIRISPIWSRFRVFETCRIGGCRARIESFLPCHDNECVWGTRGLRANGFRFLDTNHSLYVLSFGH